MLSVSFGHSLPSHVRLHDVVIVELDIDTTRISDKNLCAAGFISPEIPTIPLPRMYSAPIAILRLKISI